MFDLRGKVAIVTGGNGGIGLGMARGLAAAGARIVVAGRNRAKSAAAAKELAQLGAGGALAIDVDVTDARSVEALLAQTLERCGALHILVNNAGTNIRKPPSSRSTCARKNPAMTPSRPSSPASAGSTSSSTIPAPPCASNRRA